VPVIAPRICVSAASFLFPFSAKFLPMPRFKNLTERAQMAFCAAFKKFVDASPADLYLPIATVQDWRAAFTALNVKIHGGMPSPSGMTKAVEYLENSISGPCLCPRCGVN
jgi:hypothetical protein